MFKSYLKTTWRSFLKEKQATVLNLAGLATGLACAILIYLWVSNEVNVDKFSKNDSRLFAVMKNSPNSDGTIFTSPLTQGLLAKSLKEDLPEVEYAVSLRRDGHAGIIKSGDKHIKALPAFASGNFLKVFSYPLVGGSPANALTEPEGILISPALAVSLFGTAQQATGKNISWDHGDQFSGLYNITGVFSMPPNASEKFDVLFPFSLYAAKQAGTRGDITFWGSNSTETFVLLKKGVNANEFGEKIKDYTKNKIRKLYANSDLVKYEGNLFLQRYSDRYLYNRFEGGRPDGGRIEYVKLFSLVAIFVLLIACINFMNLSTASAARKMKEVGIRKIIGAKRSRLILQYAGRSMLLAFSSLAIALMIVLLLLPSFNTITGKHLSLQVNASFITALFVITFITGVISGSYPALYLSGFKPALVLKGKLSPVVGEVWVRKGLVVFQFAISVFLIISVLVIQGQVNLVLTKNLGYNKDNIIHFASDGKLRNGLELFTSEIKKMPGVVNASSMDGNMTGVYSQGGGGISWPGKGLNEGVEFTGLDMDYGMMEMLELQVSEGRAFSQQFADSNSVIFNESAIKAMHLDRPVGKTVTLWGAKKQIIGIVKDFQFGSMYKKTGPFFLRCTPNNSSVFVKIKRGTEKQTLARLEKFYKQYNEGLPFEYTFMDDDYNALYASEQRVSELSKYFAGLAIIISCLGLFGLVAFTAQKRRKEIGIRKVTGASVISIILLLSKDFIRLVIIALATALPLAWWVLHNWLQGFAYRVTISSGMFFIAALCVISIALLTICVQAIKAAMANPVAALRAE